MTTAIAGVGTEQELKAALTKKLKFVNDGIAKGVKVDGENVTVSQEDADAIKANWTEAQEIKGYLDMMQMSGKVETKGIDSLFSEGELRPAHEAVAPGAYGDPANDGATRGAKSLAEAFTESDEFKSFVASGRLTMDEPFQYKGADISGQFEQKDVFSGLGAGTMPLTLAPAQRDPLVPRAYRLTRVRDLFPVATTTAALIDFFRVLGYASGGAKSVPERTAPDGTAATGASTDVFGAKPRTALNFTSAQAPVRTIAHWEAAHRNVLSDVPQLQNVINTELLYGLRLEEDRQLLSGSGNNDELLGLLNTPGIQTYTAEASDRYSDALRRAATLCMLANYQSTGYVLHPYDWEKVEIQKSTGSGEYMLVTNIAVGAGAVAWRQPVVETPAIDEGTFLTGAFGLGAQIYDREEANVRISEHHEDFFVRNAIVVLCEERIAMATKRPESFVIGNLAAASA